MVHEDGSMPPGMPAGIQVVNYLNYCEILETYAPLNNLSALKFACTLVSEFSRDTLHRETCRSQGARIQHSAYTRHGCLSEQCSRLAASAQAAQAEHSPQPPQAKLYRRSYGYTVRDEIAAIYDSIRGTSRYLYDAESRYQEVLLADDGGDGTHLLFDNADNGRRC